MKKNYIKMNENDFYLSLGNFIRIVKELSKNKNSALQTEIFCTIFEVDFVNTTTINNYCVGIRSIGDTYKQHYIYLKDRYKKKKDTMLKIITNILNIVDGKLYLEIEEFTLNKLESIEKLSSKIYNIAKNDVNINSNLIKKWHHELSKKEYYSFLSEVLFYIVLENKQPLYGTDIKKKNIEKLLNDSYMSYKGIEDYLKLKLKENVNYDYNLKKLASDGNVMANYELGTNEYFGYVKGYPRYTKAYQYLLIAHNENHAGATYLIGNMLFTGMLGTKTKKDYEEAYTYFLKAQKLGSIAALNKLGLMYLHGIHPVVKDKEKSKKLFLEAADNNYAYALNNIGKIYEKEHNEIYIKYYEQSAKLKESWACNKMGEYYRLKNDFAKAFYYYKEALEANSKNLCYYAYYNLAIYFYSCGIKELGLEKNEKIFKEYLEEAANNEILEASINMFQYYIKKYLNTRDKEYQNLILKYKRQIEIHERYNEKTKKIIDDWLNKLNKKAEINCQILEKSLEENNKKNNK